MAADLHIHVFEGITKNDLERWNANVLGSKYLNFNIRLSSGEFDVLYEKMNNTPNVWVGEVSWLKASLFDDADTYIPDLVVSVHNLIGEDLPVIDDDFLRKMEIIYDASKNTTSYSVSSKERVLKFLDLFKGKRVFTISW